MLLILAYQQLYMYALSPFGTTTPFFGYVDPIIFLHQMTACFRCALKNHVLVFHTYFGCRSMNTTGDIIHVKNDVSAPFFRQGYPDMRYQAQ